MAKNKRRGTDRKESQSSQAQESPDAPTTSQAQPIPSTSRVRHEASTSTVPEVTKDIAAMSVAGGEFKDFPKNPTKPGTLGKPVALTTNMFKLDIKDTVAYHYDVVIKRAKRVAAGSKPKPPKKGKKPSPPGAEGGDDPDSPFVEVKNRDDIKRLFGDPNMFEELLRHPGRIFNGIKLGFDGMKNLYTYGAPLVDGFFVDNTFTSEPTSLILDGVQDQFILMIKNTGHFVNITNGRMEAEAKQALEIGLHYQATKAMISRGKPGKKDLFSRDSAARQRIEDVNPRTSQVYATSNLDLHTGIRKSVRETEVGLVVNIDQAAAVFQAGGPLIRVIGNILNVRMQEPQEIRNLQMNPERARKLSKELKGFRVLVNYGSYDRKHTIDSISSLSVVEETFKRDGKMVSIYNYFRSDRVPQVSLQYQNLPCIVMATGGKIPVEVCTLIPGQYYAKKLDAQLQGVVTQATATLPTRRMATITNGAATINNFSQNTLDCEITLMPLEVTGRVIPPPVMGQERGQIRNQPTLVIDSDKMRFMKPGDFEITRFSRPAPLTRWIVIAIHLQPQVVPNSESVIHNFIKDLQAKGSNFGMTIANPLPEMTQNRNQVARYIRFQGDSVTLRKELQAIVQPLVAKKMEMVFVFKPPKSDTLYDSIKTVGNDLGVLTQCLELDVSDHRDMDTQARGSKANKLMTSAFLRNMTLKMNAKMGGENFCLDPRMFTKGKSDFLSKKGLMVMGIDITHPGVGEELKHSIAGFVGSYDGNFTKYHCESRSQETARQEVIEESISSVEQVSEVLFNHYRAKNGCYPTTLVVFRDGVSEGQFDHVRRQEVKQLRNTFQKLGMKCQLVFIAAQKRHHYRNFIKKSDGKGGFIYENVLPGTVVDHSVVHPERYECYINSHHALLGSSRPAHYCVLWDDTKISRDEMQSLAYYLCYVYSRCSKPISIPAPIMYAHLVAEKAAAFVKTKYRPGHEARINDYAQIHASLKTNLFFA